MRPGTRGWRRFVQALVACIAFMVVQAPAPASASPDVIALVASAAATPADAASDETPDQATVAAPRLAALAVHNDSRVVRACPVAPLALVFARYVRNCSLLR